MAKNRVYESSDEAANIVWTNGSGSTLLSGKPVIVKNKLYIAHGDILNGASGTLIGCGCFELAALNTDTWSQGTLLGWDFANSRLTADRSGGTFFVASEAKTTGQTTNKAMLLAAGCNFSIVERTVSSGEDSANQLDITHSRGVNPSAIMVELRNTSGVQRVATVTKPDTNTVRVADANLAVNETVTAILFWA